MNNATNITINIVEPGSDLPVPDTGLFTHGIGGIESSIIAIVSIIVLLAVATFFIVRRKKGLHITKPSKRTSFILGLLAIIASVGTFTGLTLNSIHNNTNAKEGDLTVIAENADLTIEVGDEPVFAVLPVELTVQEATQVGYTLTAYTENTNLVSTTDSSKVIPMVAVDEVDNEGTNLAALADNTYGLSLVEPEGKDEEVYTALSTDPSTPTLIVNKDHEATEENDTTTIYYGFYITPDTPYGTYTGAVVNYEAEMTMATVIYNGNGLYFNDDEAQTTNTVKYVVGVTENTEKFSHTPNINDEGEASGIVGYHGGDILNKVVTIPGATKIKVQLSYGGGYISGGYPAGYLSFWQGSHPDYTTGNNTDTTIKTCGDSDVTDGKFYGDRNDQNAIITVECEIPDSSVTFAYWTQGGGPSSGAIYGYYAIVTGYDENGNIIYLNGNAPKKGEYKEPSQDLPYIFKGWSEDKEATTATYKSKNDIELNLPLTIGETTELYAIWQHATKIHFDGNGADGGVGLPDRLVAAGQSTSLSNYNSDMGYQTAYTRDGYTFNGWNTKADGSGTSYQNYSSFTAPSESMELTLYAQWSPATTIIYDGNGGTGSQRQQTIRAGETGSIYNGQSYFSRDGYVFSHWNTEPDGTGTTYNQGDSFTASDQPTTITLYAQWSPATTIIYDGNGGTGSQRQQTIRAGETGSIYNGQSYFSRTGYLFSNWNTESDGTGTTYNQGDSFTASDQPTTITLYAQWVGNVLDTGQTVNAKLKRLAGNSSASYSTADTNVTTIARASDLPADFTPTNDNTISINGSTTPIYAWYDTDTTTIYYYTESEKIIMNPNSSNMFNNFRNLSNATSIADWDTTNVTNMSAMFANAGQNATTFSLDLSSWDTSKVTNMGSMFSRAGYNATTWSIGDLSSWDTSKVTSMDSMFQYAGYNATTFSLDLSSWDTSNVTSMQTMFYIAGSNATTWSIGDLSSWDTSKVTSMGWMFTSAGYNATTFSLDLSSWDTSKVTNMSTIFSQAGYNATTFSLDLSSWDTSKVTDMSGIFQQAGRNATTFSLDLSSWDTSKVTDMSVMFNQAGQNATTFSLDLSSWDTSKVTNMGSMFQYAGYNVTTFSLDLSSWDTSKVTNMSGMFSLAGYNATTFSLDLSSWDTSKVTSMNQMFFWAGRNATTFSLDLSSWDTSKVTNMSDMFNSAGSNATTWSVTIPPKTGDIDNTTSVFYGQDSSVRATPPSGKSFTLASQANSNTTSTTESLNSVNNVEATTQGGSSGNRSVYTTEDGEDTENDDNTGLDTNSTPSRQEPLGEYQSSTFASTEDTNIVIPILIATSITLGTSALALLVYKSRRREDE